MNTQGEPASADAFFEAVSRAAEGTPYTVHRTAAGFDVTLDPDVAAARVVSLASGLDRDGGMLGEREAATSFVHHVTILGGGAYSVTDEYRRRTSWRGPMGGGVSAERGYGRIWSWRVEQTWGRDERGRFRLLASSSSTLEDGRRLIDAAAEQLGLAQQRGAIERMGLAAAIAGGLLALGTLLALAVVFLV